MLILGIVFGIDHLLVPKFRILKSEEVDKLLKKYKITKKQLPKILKTDAMLKGYNVKIGDVIEIEREEENGIKYFYYRVVVAK
ncbi:MAG: DNA-directed RNA polymerase subunit RpoH/Rpb5 C-terminal domain-containing protein [Candidatus Micrarchaeia archaeon]|jgi:DNA-directed RNA polymerase I, II, and III subunit RPABC1